MAGLSGAVALAGLHAGSAGSAAPTCLRADGCGGRIEPKLEGLAVLPRALPRGRAAPIAIAGRLRIATSGGGHPSALRRARLALDRHVAIDVNGLPVCGFRRIADSEPDRAREACRAASVGRGTVHFLITYPENTPITIKSPVTVFNGGRRDGTITLLAHAFNPIPVPEALVARVKVRRKRSGRYGWSAAIDIPSISEGHGSLTQLSLSLGRRFHRDGRRSFLSARCPDGRLFLGAPLLEFRNEIEAPGVAARTVIKGATVLPCRPRR